MREIQSAFPEEVTYAPLAEIVFLPGDRERFTKMAEIFLQRDGYRICGKYQPSLFPSKTFKKQRNFGGPADNGHPELKHSGLSMRRNAYPTPAHPRHPALINKAARIFSPALTSLLLTYNISQEKEAGQRECQGRPGEGGGAVAVEVALAG